MRLGARDGGAYIPIYGPVEYDAHSMTTALVAPC